MPQIRIAILCVVLGAAATSCAAQSPSSSAAASSAPSTAAAPITIALSEWKVAVSTTLKAGKISFTITNNGTMPHELLVFKSDLAPAAYPTDSTGKINEEGPGITLLSDGDNLDPGASQSRTVDLSAPGKYLFVCNLPAHFSAGMYTVVTVTP